MLAVAVELLAGRYTATWFSDRSEPEWPPHPARLYFALVATWADSDRPDPAERAALEWLAQQRPPDIHCGQWREREVVTHYVPVNDSSAFTGSGPARAEQLTGRETASIAESVRQVLPENRGRQGRTYPTVIPDTPTVWFVWPAAQPGDAVLRVLDDLLGRVGRLGHSATLVACRRDEAGPASGPAWVPGGSGGQARRVRVPRAGLLDRLELEYQAHRGAEPRILPAEMIDYGRPGPVRHAPRRPLLGGDWYVLGVTGRRLPGAVQALAVARAARYALLAHADQPAPEILSGHRCQPEAHWPTPPLERPHLAVVPLLNAGHPRSDGAVSGIALILPADCTVADRRSVENALRAWLAAGQRDEFPISLAAGAHSPAARFWLADLGVDRGLAGSRPQWLDSVCVNRRKITTRDYWCRPASHWVTVTPIALDRFPGNLRSSQPDTRERAEQEAVAAIARGCVNAGLADSPDDVTVSIRLDAPLAGIPGSPGGRRSPGRSQFPGYRTGGGVPRACVHAEIVFAQPVHGPVLVGAGRYLGYGLCLPSDRIREAV